MRFLPAHDDAITEAALLPAGEYAFTVVRAEDAVSAAGNPMIRLHLRVETAVLVDYVAAVSARKVLALAMCLDRRDRYDTGELRAFDVVGRSGRLRLGHKTHPRLSDKKCGRALFAGLATSPRGGGSSSRVAPGVRRSRREGPQLHVALTHGIVHYF